MRHQFPVLDEQQPEIVVATLNQPVTWTEKPADRRKSFDMPKNLSADILKDPNVVSQQDLCTQNLNLNPEP
jgi:hypothetical protein